MAHRPDPQPDLTDSPASSPLPGPAACRRCGTCCRKGGPALHPADRELVERAAIPLALLVTLRQGETARDNVRQGALVILPHELIKLRGQKRGWRCVYFDGEGAGCRIYAQRPLECRTLECWAPEALRALTAGPYLNRRDLLAGRPELLDLIEYHETHCAWERLRHVVERLRARGPDGAEALVELDAMLRYDAALRAAALQRGLPADVLPFLLGRPLAELIYPSFGLRIREQHGTLRVQDRGGAPGGRL